MAPIRPSHAKAERNFFDSPIVEVYVHGKTKAFKIHKTALQTQSSFLEKMARCQRRTVENAAESVVNHEDVCPDDEEEEEEVKSEATFMDAIDLETGDDKKALVYDLKETKVRKDTFEIFVAHLYDKNPGPIHDRIEAKKAVRAYILAKEYEVLPLQNALVDRLRLYHQTSAFDLDLLVLLINRHGDVDCKMRQYLVQQMSYDLSSDGYNKFSKENQFLEKLIIENSREVRREVFEEIVSIAVAARRKQKIQDPADITEDTRCKYHAHEDGAVCDRRESPTT